MFINGGQFALNERWFMVRMQCLLLMFIHFSHLNDITVRARKGVVSIFKLVWSLGERSPSIFFKLFDVQIQSILNYGVEVSVIDADLKTIERIHLFALKIIYF